MSRWGWRDRLCALKDNLNELRLADDRVDVCLQVSAIAGIAREATGIMDRCASIPQHRIPVWTRTHFQHGFGRLNFLLRRLAVQAVGGCIPVGEGQVVSCPIRQCNSTQTKCEICCRSVEVAHKFWSTCRISWMWWNSLHLP